jgi:polysaccharide deacetylase 2 family uncharacterized protein YibQ
LLRIIIPVFLLIFNLYAVNEIEVIDYFDSKEQNYTTYINYEDSSKTKINKSVKKESKQENKKNNNDKNITKVIKKDKKLKKTGKKPKLLIIIDDISNKTQLKKLKDLNIKINPSIFPPNKMNMKSHLLAKGLKHYLIHLPLESRSKVMNKMHKTIFTYYSQKQINNRIKEIRKLFPNAKYINNHTGSKFSENYEASKKLYNALINYGFIFLDSRTSKKSKFKKIAKEFHKRYLKCDHFIDNKLDVQATLKEIKKGIAIAKRNGIAVIIGHPHPTTFKALKIAKKTLFKQVKLIYIDEL